MKVKAIRDHFYDGTYRATGEEFEHNGKLHAHIAPVKRVAEPDESEPGDESGKTPPASERGSAMDGPRRACVAAPLLKGKANA